MLPPLSEQVRQDMGREPSDHGSSSVAQEWRSTFSTDVGQDSLPMTFADIDFNSNLDWILEETNDEPFFGGPESFTLVDFYDDQDLQTRHLPALQTTETFPARLEADAPMPLRPDDASTTGSASALGGILSPQPQQHGGSGEPWAQYTL